MAGVSITCPNCAKILRSSARPAPGRKVKCPACGKAFLPELDEEDEAASIQEEPSLKARPRKSDEDHDEKPRKKRPRNEDTDLDEQPTPKKTNKKDKGKKNSKLVLIVGAILCGGFLLVTCAGLGLAAFVWPGFLRSKDNNNNPMAFVPANANLIFGANAKGLREKGQLDQLLKVLNDKAKDDKLPAEVQELIKSADQVVMCGQTQDKDMAVIAVLASNAVAVEKFKKTPALGKVEKLASKYDVYRPKGKNDRDWPKFVTMPGDRLVIFSDLTEANWIALLDRAKKGDATPSPVLQHSKSIEQAHLWAAVSLDDKIRSEIKASADNAQGPMIIIKPALGALQKAKGGNISGDFADDKSWKVQLSVEYANDADALEVKKGGEGLKTLAGMFAGELFAGPKGPKGPKIEVPPAINQDINSIVFDQKGATVSMSFRLSSDTLDIAGKSMLSR